MIALQLVAASVLLAFALPASAAAAPAPRSDKPSASGAAAAPHAVTRRTPFTHFGAGRVLPLRGDAASAVVDFGSRADELVTRATLHLRYAFSPALTPGVSHIKVTLNEDLLGTLPVTAENAGKPAVQAIEVDPRLVAGANRLVFTLVASRTPGAAETTRPGLWAEVGGTSELELVLQPLAVADDLALVPEPFFDRRDQRRVTVPFVFAARPSTGALRAAAVVSSWLGVLAHWRGARFPVQLDGMAQGHAIAFAANDERPAALASLPPASGPRLLLMTNPADGRSKLLVIAGRDAADLKVAADALVVGNMALSGASMQVAGVEQKAPRAPYDAPGMVRTDRAMTFGELIDWPQQLQAAGRPPDLDAIRMDLRVPPDLATWRGPGVPLRVKVQYTPPPCAADARLEMSVNDELLQVATLRNALEPIASTHELFIPPYRLRSRSQLQFRFRFPLREDCRDTRPDSSRAVVEADSTIDFSGFPHYARMPNLNHFATVGYPFTRHADLAQTVVVLPDVFVAADIEVMLGLMARLGEATGYPATHVRVATAKDEGQLGDADLLLIGATPQHALLAKWADRMPVALSGHSRRVSQSLDARARLSDWLGVGAPVDTSIATQVEFEGAGPIAALLGFESPATSGRSVVAVTAVAPDQALRLLDALDNVEQRNAVRGSAAFVLPNKVESVLAGDTYTVGFLPPWTGAGYWLRDRPAVAATLVLVPIVVVVWITLRRRARARRWRW